MNEATRGGFLRTVSLARWAIWQFALTPCTTMDSSCKATMSEFACHDHDFIVDIEFLSIFQFLIFKWVFPKIMVPPNHPFVHRVFHYFHHPFWGTPIFGNTQINLRTNLNNFHGQAPGLPVFLSLGLVRASRAFRGSQSNGARLGAVGVRDGRSV